MVAFGLMIDVSTIPNTVLNRAGRLDTNNYHSLLEQPVATSMVLEQLGLLLGRLLHLHASRIPGPCWDRRMLGVASCRGICFYGRLDLAY